MSRLNSILRKLADPKDRELLDHSPTRATRLRIIGRIGLRYWWAYLLVLMVLSVGTVSAGMDVYHRTEQPQFCGACHEMGNNFASWGESRHKNITCADCHAQEGAVGWMKTKMAGLRQLKVHFTADSIGDIKVQANQRKTISENCRRCHDGVARVGERFGLGVSHRQHLAQGMDCVACHTSAFTHPVKPKLAKDDAKAEGEEKAEAKAEVADADHPAMEQRFVDVSACYQCHDGKTEVGAKVAFNAKDEQNCLKCHPDANHATGHGARSEKSANRKPCLDCHDLPGEGQPHFQVADVGEICTKCHTPLKVAKKHNPYKRGECAECHKVMSPAYLFKSGPRPTNDSCLGCHDEIKTLLALENASGMDLGGFTDQNKDLHKLHGDKLGQKTNDWCLDCHSPHGSDSERGLVALRPHSDDKKPPSFVVNEEVGGKCTGGCHEKAAPYTGPTD